MATHVFADMMHHLYQAFDLFKKDDKRRAELRNGNFSYHQSFFGKTRNTPDEEKVESGDGDDIFNSGYDDIIKKIDPKKVFNHYQRRDIFFKYEQLYNALMRIPVFSHSDNKKVAERYIHSALPPIVALDIYNTLEPGDESHLYYHIHCFLTSNHCPFEPDDTRPVYKGVQTYLRELIKRLQFSSAANLGQINNFISNIKKGCGQNNESIKQKINLCRAKNIENMIPKKYISAHEHNLDIIEQAYLSLNLLLVFERETSAVNLLSRNYRYTVANGIGYNTSYGILCRYLYSSGYDETLIHDITLAFFKEAIWPITINIENSAFYYIQHLKMVIFNANTEYFWHHSAFLRMSCYLNNPVHSDVLEPYAKLAEAIYLLCHNKLNEACSLINGIELKNLPFGYLPSAFAIIKLALKIKTERNAIRNKTLLLLINAAMVNQRITPDYIALTEGEIDGPVVSCANNMIIMRAIKTYNCMILKINDPDEAESVDIYPQAIHGIFDEIERALGKLNKLLKETDDNIGSERLSELILQNNTLTVRELSESLIGFLDHCTLHNCLTSLNILIHYLRCPKESMVNIVMLAGTTDRSQRVREKICKALQLANEKLADLKNLSQKELSDNTI
ncbi:hypothetical protein MPJ64_003994 [Escherichia coli]|nr:hypothetical protein [Escherichia coli]EIZ1279555.1 hypothetical protein [Escherichia coli]MCV8297195.1 hypothetical protein [Escherichia coli]QLN32050.1 hypothetical protein HVZ76_04820 [Escherichia coli]HBV0260503.1 hypothetical protein [Escherichia coli]